MRYLQIAKVGNAKLVVNAIEWDGHAAMTLPAHHELILASDLPPGLPIHAITDMAGEWSVPELRYIGDLPDPDEATEKHTERAENA